IEPGVASMTRQPHPKAWAALCVLLLAALACNLTGPAPTPSSASTPTGAAATAAGTPPPTLTTVPTPAVSPTPLPPIAPRVIDHPPVQGDELAPTGAITVYFDGPMDQASVQSAFAVQPAVPGSFSWPDPSTLTFKPNQDLERASAYTVTIQNT